MRGDASICANARRHFEGDIPSAFLEKARHYRTKKFLGEIPLRH
jgi:hypothetical protein